MSLIGYGEEHDMKKRALHGGPVGETQFERVERLGRESEERWAKQDAEALAHKLNGTNVDMGPAVPSDLSYRPRRGGVWS